MDELVRKVLLEIIEIEYQQHNRPLCGASHWCDAVIGFTASTPCEHARDCKRSYGITERLLALKGDVQRAPILEVDP